MIELSSITVDLINQYGLLGVFFAHLLAYSIIPFPSEAAIIGAALVIDPVFVILAALLGSTLGSLTNYLIGKKGIKRFMNHKSRWYKRSLHLFETYGGLSIVLLGNFPLIGDPLMIIAGSFEMKLSRFLLYSTIGKTLYFILIILVGKGIENLIM